MQDALIDLVSLDKDIRHQRDPAFCFFDEAEPEPASKFSGAAELLRFIIVEFFPRKVGHTANAGGMDATGWAVRKS